MKKLALLLMFMGFLLTYAQNQSRELVILHTNDTHSQIESYTHKADTNVGGFLRREAAIRDVRAQHRDVLVLDAGDFSQGTPYFNFFGGYVEVELMNAMHYDVAALGNHEFDNGSAALAKRLKKAKFQVVCANYQFLNKSLARQVKPYVIIRKASRKIGIVGLTVDLQPLVSPSVYAELVYQDPIRVTRDIVDVLKKKHCDLIICLSHLGVGEGGVNDFVLAQQVPDVDVIIGGHSHVEMAQPKVVGKTRIFQMTNRGKCIGEIIITD